MNNQQKKDLIKFVDFHSRAQTSTVNSIQAVISSKSLEGELKEVFDLLKKDYIIIKYSKNIEPIKFIEELLWPLYQGKTVLVETDTLDFDPVIYDQLIQLRESNKFSLSFAQKIPISPTSSIFLSYVGDKNDKKIDEIADHIFRMEETN